MKISYAEAVTTFEFKKQRAIPVVTGIVVAKEKEDAVLEEYWKSEAAAEERDKARRESRALKRWGKLIHGLRVRLRLQAEYGGAEDVSFCNGGMLTTKLSETQHNPMSKVASVHGSAPAPSAATIIAKANQQSMEAWVANVREGDDEPEDEMEEVPIEPKVEPVEHEPSVESAAVVHRGRPKRATANGTAKPTRGKKRHADTESEDDEPPQRNGRTLRLTVKALTKATPPTTGRVTRSRGAKTEEQKRKEEEHRARIKAALASDNDESD